MRAIRKKDPLGGCPVAAGLPRLAGGSGVSMPKSAPDHEIAGAVASSSVSQSPERPLYLVLQPLLPDIWAAAPGRYVKLHIVAGYRPLLQGSGSPRRRNPRILQLPHGRHWRGCRAAGDGGYILRLSSQRAPCTTRTRVESVSAPQRARRLAVDVVIGVGATPPGLHLEPILAAALVGKPVLTEKPLAANPAQALTLAALD
jgi:hypothetical protein